jgi:hypothetical protein
MINSKVKEAACLIPTYSPSKEIGETYRMFNLIDTVRSSKYSGLHRIIVFNFGLIF